MNFMEPLLQKESRLLRLPDWPEVFSVTVQRLAITYREIKDKLSARNSAMLKSGFLSGGGRF
jgi:hypothetical protein